MAKELPVFSEDSMKLIKSTVEDYLRRNRSKYPLDHFEEPRDTIFAPEVYIAEVPEGGIPALTRTTVGETGTGSETTCRYIPGSATCNIYKIQVSYPTGTKVEELVETEFTKTVYNLSESAIPGPRTSTGTGTATGTSTGTVGTVIEESCTKKFQIVWRDKYGHWVTKRFAEPGLVELCAQGNAQRNVPYQCLLGTWDPDTQLWCYDNAETVYAIDHRIGPPYAQVGWKGLYQEMPSTDADHNDRIYICVSLDCELPDEGCNLCD